MLKSLIFLSLSATFLACTLANQQAVDCTNDALIYYPNEDGDTTNELLRFYAANNVLTGMCLFNQIMTLGEENIVTMIYPLMFHIAQWAKYTNNTKQAEFFKIINLNSNTEIDEVLLEETKYYNAVIPYKYSSKMEYIMMADNKYQFNDDFKNSYSHFIGGETVNHDFEDSSTTANYLNDWMRQESCNQDHDFLSSEKNLSELGLVSASFVHFTVYWGESFKPLKKVPIDFYKKDGNVISTDAFYFEGYAYYAEDKKINSQVIEFPMLGDFKMRLLVPNPDKEIDDLIFDVRSPDTYENAFAKTERTYLKLTLPFEEEICSYEDYSKGIKLVNIMTEAFDRDSNLFSMAFEDGIGCHLSQMFHKTHLSIVDVQGEENVTEVSENSEYAERNVEVNTAFMFDIMCFNNTRMFSGVIQKPN